MLDRVSVSVLTHRFEAIVQEMGEAMLRTAYSQILNSSRDFSTALCDAAARLVAQAEHVPIHVGAIPWAVEAVRDAFTGRIKPGDVYLLNDPYHGGNHLPDLTALVPVFVEGALAFWSINRSHQSDIGGSTHGAYNPAATEIWQEGLRITPLKLYDAGELRDDVTLDPTDCHPQVIGFVNSSFPNTMSAVHMAIAYLIDPDIPKNSGTFRPVTVIAKRGTIVWPFPPAPVTLATNHCAQEVAEA